MKIKITASFCLAILTAQLCFGQRLNHEQFYGNIDTADLKLKSCPFEKSASAMVLSDYGEFMVANTAIPNQAIIMKRHIRIKIFDANNTGPLENVRLSYFAGSGFEEIDSLEAETINIEGNKIICTLVDPKLIYLEKVDKYHKALSFAFANIKAGSVIEYQYRWKTKSAHNFPPWFFQTTIPTRFSELAVNIFSSLKYSIKSYGNLKSDKDTVEKIKADGAGEGYRYIKAMTNVRSFTIEPLMDMVNTNLQEVALKLHSPLFPSRVSSWAIMTEDLMNDESFGGQLNISLGKQDTLLNKVKLLKTNDEKISLLFNTIKKTITWNKVNRWYTQEGIKKAWNKRTGNSAEVNLILCNLLRNCGVEAYPMVVSTRDNGPLDTSFAEFGSFNKTVVYIPEAGNVPFYILDASCKYNVYNEMPAELLNTWGFAIKDIGKGNSPDLYTTWKLIYLKNDDPGKEFVSIQAQISPENKVAGTIDIASYSYNKVLTNQMFDELGVVNYTNSLRNNNNEFQISNFNIENRNVDSLPLLQKFNFNLRLTGGDDNYIYFNPCGIIPMNANPFTSNERFSDIDFISCSNISISGKYTLPEGYKIDALPKNTTMLMYDKSISFVRVVGQVDNTVQVRYVINRKQSRYSAKDYQFLHDFYKKMFEMLNEPIVLKRGA